MKISEIHKFKKLIEPRVKKRMKFIIEVDTDKKYMIFDDGTKVILTNEVYQDIAKAFSKKLKKVDNQIVIENFIFDKLKYSSIKYILEKCEEN